MRWPLKEIPRLRVMESDDSSLEFGVFGDLVNAEFHSGGYVPRLPAGLCVWGITQNAVC